MKISLSWIYLLVKIQMTPGFSKYSQYMMKIQYFSLPGFHIGLKSTNWIHNSFNFVMNLIVHVLKFICVISFIIEHCAFQLVNTRRARRSRSLEAWLEHRPLAPVPLPTVLQPVMNRRKSVSKLTDAKDMVSGEVDRYCLVTQGQDSEGDLEARIYKVCN